MGRRVCCRCKLPDGRRSDQHAILASAMTSEFKTRMGRRKLLQRALVAGGALLVRFDNVAWPRTLEDPANNPFADGKQLGAIPFTEEARVPMETALGAELDGRLYTDLSTLTPQNRVTPTDKFYLRTRASQLLDLQKPWPVTVGGLVEKPFDLSVAELNRMASPVGAHLMECAGNERSVHFGMMSVADWAGAPLSELLESAKPKPEATRVLISGFDTYATKSARSVPGASWIFRYKELRTSRAFLATEMSGSPLTTDHGAPVRLVIPGWYGCACIKWVNEITFTDDTAAATSQMQEYAARTMQNGVPHFAREYKPATVDPAAMPIRVEKWVVEGKIKYRVVGILWGGSGAVKDLEIRFNPEEEYVPVGNLEQPSRNPWSFWTHEWVPSQTGTYMIRLRVKDLGVVARRLDLGYYMRTVEVTEI
jgi:DMSO/TMAO reductase YedYZ molybdopterin-dependent catalytic subunit